VVGFCKGWSDWEPLPRVASFNVGKSVRPVRCSDKQVHLGHVADTALNKAQVDGKLVPVRVYHGLPNVQAAPGRSSRPHGRPWSGRWW
jgi:hypothetical protein